MPLDRYPIAMAAAAVTRVFFATGALASLSFVACSALTSFENFVGPGEPAAPGASSSGSSGLPNEADSSGGASANDAGSNDTDANTTDPGSQDSGGDSGESDAAVVGDGGNCKLVARTAASATTWNVAGSSTWTNPDSARLPDGVAAISTAGPNLVSHFILLHDFQFVIPTSATIRGVQVVLRRRASPGVMDREMRLAPGGSPSGAVRKSVVALPTNYEDLTYGGTQDRWALPLTPQVVDDANFGIAYSVIFANDAQSTAEVDSVQAIVWYCE
jgi:hypothetical protein